jgi:glycerophosphoryl diester phosphodiesterase
MKAFERAIRLGYPGVELDVRIAKDGVPVVVHDASVRRGRRRRLRVRETKAAELDMLSTLEAVLALPWGRKTLMIEVKHDAGALRRNRRSGEVVARAIARSGLANAMIASFSADVLEAARKAEPALRRVAILDEETWREDRRRRLAKLPVFAWAVDLGWLEVDEAAASIRARGGALWAWTIADLRGLKTALALGVDGIITDIPGKVLQRLGRVPRSRS